MAKFVVEGPSTLSGTIKPIGNKNSVLKLIPASILFKGDYTLTNVPGITDVDVAVSILEAMGATISYDKVSQRLTINTDGITSSEMPLELVKKYRASVSFIGPMLARFGHVKSVFPGGDKIGPRELTAHFASLAQLGVKVEGNQWGEFELIGKPVAGDSFLYEPSVTATENLILAAAFTKGTTRIMNAACEPHVQELCEWLAENGVEIQGIGSNLLIIKGTDTLSTNGREHEVWPDYLDIGTFLVAGAVTNSELRLTNVRPQDLITIKYFYSQLGLEFSYEGNDLILTKDQALEVKDPIWGRTKGIYSQPWYCFPSDLMSVSIVLAMATKGSTVFFEKLYPDRLSFVSYFNAAGANIIICDPHRIVVNGKTKLNGFNYVAPDIRAGMAYFIAALAAEGKSEIFASEHIDRGYPDTMSRFQALGAKVERVD